MSTTTRTDAAVEALRAVDFQWAVHLESVWRDPVYDVPQLNQHLRSELEHKLNAMQNDDDRRSPLGWVIAGSGGTGKTHLLSILRREALARRIGFVLVDMTDVHDFWETVLLGYWGALQQDCGGGLFQHELLLELFIATLRPRDPLDVAIRKLRSSPRKLTANVRRVLAELRKIHPREMWDYQDVIRALIAMNSDDFTQANVGHMWLQGNAIEDEHKKALEFTAARKEPRDIVRGLSWLMSLVGPTVLAFDQLDPIVAELRIVADAATEGSREEMLVARSIIESISSGLADIRDKTCRTLSVVSCLETTWDSLRKRILSRANVDRFEEPRALGTIHDAVLAEGVVRLRLEHAYQRVGFVPPYPTWPVAPEAFHNVQGMSPREILKVCESHRRRCLDRGVVEELPVLSIGAVASGSLDPAVFQKLDEQFHRHRAEADLVALLDEKADDERLAPLLQAACRCLVHENPPPPDVDAVVDVDFQGGKTTRPLHARVRLIYHDQDEREEHFCLRALQRKHPNAFQARLKAAMTLSGIDKRLRFRRLVIVRSEDKPGGAVTEQLLKQFCASGGQFAIPTEDELRTLWALGQLYQPGDVAVLNWLHSRKPASQLALMKLAVPALCGAAPDLEVDPKPGHCVPVIRPPELVVAAAPSPAPFPPARPMVEDFQLGRRLVGGRPGKPLTMPIQSLEKHAIVLAGSGSGKTVLVRRIVEEAALAGIPSIVIDCANDLATLGDPWPEPPASWEAEDHQKAKAYHAAAEVVVWTPGREAGRPLVLEPLPDLTPVVDDEDELNHAVAMVRESLAEVVAPGASAAARNKIGVLSSGLKYFARQGGGSLLDFVRLLADLPPDAGLGIQKEARLAHEMADRLCVEMETNVLLRGSGAGLDPAVLFGDVRGAAGVRVSVVNFVGLANLETQRQFLNQLAMTLFSWIKKNPSPPGRPLRGLLVIDEAKDFAPSRGGSVSKESLMRLVNQARKYHLAMVFATQHPKDIENKIVGNCSTQYYGKANSPAAIDALREQLRLCGGDGGDIPTLERGCFYVYNADTSMPAPIKVQIPMCLSHHRNSPLEEQEILDRAAAPPRGK